MGTKKRLFFNSGITPATRSHYRHLVRRQVNNAIPDRCIGNDLHGLNDSDLAAAAERLLNRGHEYAPATRRLYKASLAWCLSEQREKMGEAWGSDAERLLDRLVLAGPMRTAETLRRVPIKFEKWLREQDDLSGARLAIKKFFLANIHVGLRPVEWFGARFLCPWPPVNGYNVVLHIRAAKTTHGRGRGAWREISLSGLHAAHLNDVIRFWLHLNNWIDSSAHWRGVDFETCDVQTRASASWFFYQPLRDVWWGMRRELIEKGVLDVHESNLAFYSTRHQAVASAKRELEPEDVARVFGHAVPTTARLWYGWRRDGRNGFGARPYDDAKSLAKRHEIQQNNEVQLNIETFNAGEEQRLVQPMSVPMSETGGRLEDTPSPRI